MTKYISDFFFFFITIKSFKKTYLPTMRSIFLPGRLIPCGKFMLKMLPKKIKYNMMGMRRISASSTMQRWHFFSNLVFAISLLMLDPSLNHRKKL